MVASRRTGSAKFCKLFSLVCAMVYVVFEGLYFIGSTTLRFDLIHTVDRFSQFQTRSNLRVLLLLLYDKLASPKLVLLATQLSFAPSATLCDASKCVRCARKSLGSTLIQYDIC